MTKSMLIAATLAAALGLTACNTVAGAGKDVSSVGKATTKTAKDAAPSNAPLILPKAY